VKWWRFVHASKLIAAVTDRISEAEARAIARVLAGHVRGAVTVYGNGAKVRVGYPIANPSAGTWCLDCDRKPVARLHVGADALARRIATILARRMRSNVHAERSSGSRARRRSLGKRSSVRRKAGRKAPRRAAGRKSDSRNPPRSQRAKARRRAQRTLADDARLPVSLRLRADLNRRTKRAGRRGATTRAEHHLAESRRRSSARRKNPATASELERARKTFRKWHQFDAKDVVRVKGSDRIPRTLVKLGEIPEFIYRSNKWEGKAVTYRHVTKRPRPLLCTGPSGKGLYIVGGNTRVTDAGLVN